MSPVIIQKEHTLHTGAAVGDVTGQWAAVLANIFEALKVPTTHCRFNCTHAPRATVKMGVLDTFKSIPLHCAHNRVVAPWLASLSKLLNTRDMPIEYAIVNV